MVDSPQQITPGSAGLLAEQAASTSVGGATATVAAGGNGIRPAVQARVETGNPDKPGGSAGADVTATVGQGISASAHAQYNITDGNTQVRLGISGQYNQVSGASVAAGARVDYNTGVTVGPVSNIGVHASVVSRTGQNGGTGVEVGVSGTANVLGHNVTGTVGVRHNTQGGTTVVIGVGRTF